MLCSVLAYLGIAMLGAGLLSLVSPLGFLRIRTRRVAGVVAAVGLFCVLVAFAWPVRTHQAATPVTRLDEWMPVWQFGERHTIHVGAPPEKIFAAIRAVRAEEIFLFRTLTALRRFGRPGPESRLKAPEQQPLLDVATQTTFVKLADEPPRELVVGTVVLAPRSLYGSSTRDLFRKAPPEGVALATMNFLVTPDANGGSTVSTETRIFANNSSAVRRFAIYWRMVHPGSDIIRRMWLRAIRRRAEGNGPTGA
jgi:hypothetical protein